MPSNETEQMYVMYNDGVPVGYAYGPPWVAQALMMDDWKYPTEEAAKEAWRKYEMQHKGDLNV